MTISWNGWLWAGLAGMLIVILLAMFLAIGQRPIKPGIMAVLGLGALLSISITVLSQVKVISSISSASADDP